MFLELLLGHLLSYLYISNFFFGMMIEAPILVSVYAVHHRLISFMLVSKCEGCELFAGWQCNPHCCHSPVHHFFNLGMSTAVSLYDISLLQFLLYSSISDKVATTVVSLHTFLQ
jgi:hypothetical protein